MTDTRTAAIDKLFAKWEKDARHFDDYRGILSCIKDLKQVMTLTDVPLPADVHTLVTRAEAHLRDTKGKPFFDGPATNLLVQDLVTMVKALSESKPTGKTLAGSTKGA